jgi:FkbM family methyltransferase
MAGNKRIDLLIDALSIVRQSVPNAVLLLVGDDRGNPAIAETAAKARARAEELGLTSQVIFTGVVDDQAPYYRLAEVYATASLHEGFGVPLIEAMASGVPVVASNATAHPWVVGEAGLLAEPGAAPDLAAQIVRVLTDDQLHGELVQRGLARAKEFSLEHFEAGWGKIAAEATEWLPDQPFPHVRSLPTATPERAAALAQARADELKWLDAAADVMQRGYVVRSNAPLVGPLIAWVRRNLTSHLREPYLDPTLERQVAFNREVAQALQHVFVRLAAVSDMSQIALAGPTHPIEQTEAQPAGGAAANQFAAGDPIKPERIIPMTDSILTYTVEGRDLRFRVRPGTDDCNIIREVGTNEYYRNGRALLTPASTVIDVGGHIGSYSIFSALTGARAVVLEPVPANFELINENIRLNNLQDRIKAINAAIWSSAGEMSLGLADDSTGGSGFWYKKPTVPQLTVRTLRLSEVMTAEKIETCDLLKLDCEGAEFEILNSLEPEVWPRIRAIVMEYHLFAGYTLEQMDDLLRGHGYLFSRRALSPGSGYGYVLAIRPPLSFLPIPALTINLADSPYARLPVLGWLWRLARKPIHELIVFYLNQVIHSCNLQQQLTTAYLNVLAQDIANKRAS